MMVGQDTLDQLQMEHLVKMNGTTGEIRRLRQESELQTGGMKRFEPLLLFPLLFLHGVLYNEIGEISAARGVDFGPLMDQGLDAAVPFLSAFVIPYMFAWGFPVFLIGYLMLATKTPAASFRPVFAALVVLLVTCYTLWITFPVYVGLRLDETFLAEGGWLDQLVLFNYQNSSYWNACPSFHVAGPWFLYRTAKLLYSRLPRVFLWIALAIIVSTVLIRIHYLMDIVGGLLVSELAVRLVFINLRKHHTLENLSSKTVYIYSLSVIAVGFAGYAYLARV